MQEEWKQIEEAPRYYVSNKGRVAYIPRNGKEKYKFAKTTFNNYILQVSLYLKNNKHATRSVAKLVATAFIDNPHNYYYIKHKNGNPLDNNVANLKWQKTNLEYSPREGKYYPRGKHKKIDELFYKILDSIESDYGDVSLCPEYDERLRFLRTY